MNGRPATQDRQAKPTTREVGLARITYSGSAVGCSCGWVRAHPREKVLEDSIDRHLSKKHGGRGIRLG